MSVAMKPFWFVAAMSESSGYGYGRWLQRHRWKKIYMCAPAIATAEAVKRPLTLVAIAKKKGGTRLKKGKQSVGLINILWALKIFFTIDRYESPIKGCTVLDCFPIVTCRLLTSNLRSFGWNKHWSKWSYMHVRLENYTRCRGVFNWREYNSTGLGTHHITLSRE